MKRYFHLRYSSGFTPEIKDAVRRGFRIWKNYLDQVIATWSERRTTPIPVYIVEPPYLSDDRTVITVALSGDPGSYGAMKLFEDGVPYPMYGILEPEVRRNVEVCYENPELGPPEWILVGDARRPMDLLVLSLV